ncbi:Ornithine decarboxylase [Ophidiomyces ophidiicola]|nr:Ornithine decarboxylase [Ophidiomyces ophidiicola]KAI1921119.1 Ornithine decarboxylase [Ophidiomyces ophidiicola]KAI2020720.1 Ornithine decarboxylase [Ophidiomyces ophidiicola]KAI2024919.1 Ornithine decarboxylase [Ophidiomyces ophidiicola]KAI2060006.1 Ornithine decarboxylase [Ophidiomyces ophidiicola]
MEVVNQKNLASSYSPNAIPPLVQSKVLNHLHGDSTFKDSFFVADETYIQHQLKRWESRFEDIQPFYAMKCNDNPTVLKILAKNGAGFDCASKSEIKRILELGVEPHRILFAAPFKSEDHVLYAKKHGVKQTMFDSEDELRKLATYFPTAALYLRLWADDPTSRARLSEKFGVRLQEAKELLKLAKDLNMRVVGLCFHVGSSASDCDAYRRAIALTREVYDYNETFGEGRKHPIGTVDVGGGFSSENFDDAATAIRQAIREYFDIERKIRWVAEPGRFFVHEAFHLICRVIGTRPKGRLDHQTALGETIPTGDIYINDGIYHNFLNALTEKVVPQPILLDKSGVPCRQSNEARGKYTVWGQTCDSFDKILMDCPLPSGARVGEWLYFPAMGCKWYALV